MRVAHITATFPPYRGGTGTVCYHNALETARLGHDVHVFTAGNGLQAAGDDPLGVTIHRLNSLFRVGNAPLTPRLLTMPAFDIYHLHFPFIFGAELTFIRSLMKRVPYVITYHQDLILDGLIGRGVLLHEATVGRTILNGTARLLFTSSDYGHNARIAPLVKHERVGEIPNGVDIERFCPDLDVSQLRQQYRLSPSDRVVSFVAGLDKAHYFKGVSVLLKALARLDGVKAVIVGDGDLRPSYEAEARERGLEDRVIFTGRVPVETLPLHYALGDVLVLPSTTMGEAFGIVLLEAMACGRPVIASNLPGVRTVVDEGRDGLLFPVGDDAALAQAITTILDHPERIEMGKRGRAKVEARYTWSHIAGMLVNVYDEVVKGG